jgi:hypothetical protein
MKAENWKNIKDVLLEILNLDPSGRRGFLEKADVSFEIRREVESLLAFETESEDLMRVSAVEFSKDFFAAEDAPRSALIGRRVGDARPSEYRGSARCRNDPRRRSVSRDGTRRGRAG